ncbi:DUF6352 family protein [Ferrovibrio sp.]|jgi:hypothetical protein|uniref:DUF6352 family protein n=1 Tax=Ferrovibrio sp. TaxID=1917215 RepID=UPI0035B221F5
MADAPGSFWMSSGYDLLDRADDGRLLAGADFIRAYLSRPEMLPPDEACAAERRLYADLLQQPLRAVPADELAGLADADARENYNIFLRFRDHLLRAGSVEAAYVGLFRPDAPPVPALFIDHLAATILRDLLDGSRDAFRLRAAELFFRVQKATTQEGRILLADEETVEMLAAGGFGSLGALVAQAGTALRSVDMDILTKENAAEYWGRSDRHDFVLDFGFTRPGQDAFARVIELWVERLAGAAVQVHPVQTIRDERWVWHIGLDATASGIMNALYEGQSVEEDRLRQILALFRLEFRDPSLMLPRVAGRPVYLGLAMDAQGRVRMKPQNLVINLPLNSGS